MGSHSQSVIRGAPRSWLIFLALVIYALGVLGALAAPGVPAPGNDPGITSGIASAPPPTSVGVPTAPPGVHGPGATLALPQPVIGFAVNLHHTDRLDLYLRAVDQMVAMGFNTIEVLTPAFQRDGAAEDIQVEVGPGKSPSREQLVTLLRYARDRGLTVDLMPLVLFTDPRGNEWRGKIEPEHWDRWWQSYRHNIDYFVDVANEAGVSIFSVGSELLSTEKQIDRWERLIAGVRKRFHGRLSYSTNWDHYTTPTFWDRLDMIGINGYWDLTREAKSGHESDPKVLAKAWHKIRKEVLDFGASMGKPVLLTEIGYPSLPWGLKDPWNYVNTTDAQPDFGVQAAGYTAFLAAWKDMLAHPDPRQLVGVCFFEWDVYHDGDKDDTGYGIRGKPTYELLKKWLASRK